MSYILWFYGLYIVSSFIYDSDQHQVEETQWEWQWYGENTPFKCGNQLRFIFSDIKSDRPVSVQWHLLIRWLYAQPVTDRACLLIQRQSVHLINCLSLTDMEVRWKGPGPEQKNGTMWSVHLLMPFLPPSYPQPRQLYSDIEHTKSNSHMRQWQNWLNLSRLRSKPFGIGPCTYKIR